MNRFAAVLARSAWVRPTQTVSALHSSTLTHQSIGPATLHSRAYGSSHASGTRARKPLWRAAAAVCAAATVLAFEATCAESAGSGSEASASEFEVARLDDLRDGEMKELEIAGAKILLSRVAGKYYATGLKCSHYGAPLSKGVLVGEAVTCPWHDAAFSVRTGEALTAPAMDSLPVYHVREADGRVFVTVPPGGKPNVRPGGGAGCGRCCDKRVIVIVGGGAAGLVAAETLRNNGFKGRLVMLTRERDLPYDRTMLSKNLGVALKDITLRDEDFFKSHGIEVHRGQSVVGVTDTAVQLEDGSTLAYDKLLLAPGLDARTLQEVPGSSLDNIHTVRMPSDAAAVKERLAGGAKHAVVVGSSFIGMEAASSLKKLGAETISIVGRDQVPLQKVLGTEVGRALQELAQDTAGVRFVMGRTVKEFAGKNGQVASMVLDDGTVLPADVVVVGAGAVPATQFLNGWHPVEADGAVRVDEHLRLQAKSDGRVFAAGDIAAVPYRGGPAIRVEHWNVAQQQGRIAAHNMLAAGDKPMLAYAAVPFFWTGQFGKGLRFAGHTNAPDDVIIKGSLKDLKFIAYYTRNDEVVAVASAGNDPAASIAKQLLAASAMPTRQEVLASDGSLEFLQDVLRKQTAAEQ